MKRIYFTITTIIVLLSASNIQCLAENYNHDAVYQKIVKEYTLQEDGSIEYHFYKKLELKTYYSFHRSYGETFIVYNPEFQNLKINKAVTTMADGKKVPVPDNAFNEVLPQNAKNAPAYNHLREMVVTHTGLQKGAIIELDYTITTKAGFYPLLLHREILSKEIPVKEMILRAEVPNNKTLYHQTSRIRTAPEIRETKASKNYTWKFTNLKPQPNDPYLAEPQTYLPVLEFSTGDISKEIANHYKAIIKKSSSAKAKQYFETVSDMLEINQSTDEKKSVKSKIKNIIEYVDQSINHYSIDPLFYGFKPRAVHDIIRSNGATVYEAALLIAEMLKHQGFKSDVIYVFSGDKSKNLLFPEYPLVRIQHDHHTFLLDPFDNQRMNPMIIHRDYTFYSLSGDRVIKNNYPQKENKFDLEMDLQVNDDGSISGKATVELTNGMNPYFSFWLDPEAAVKGLGKKTGLEFSNAEIEANSDKTVIKANVNAGSVQSYGDLKYISLKKMSPYLKKINASRLPEETQGLFDLGMTINEKINTKIKFPEKYKLNSDKRKHMVKSNQGYYLVELKTKRDAIEFERQIIFNQSRYKPDGEYQYARKLILKFNDRKSNQIMFP
ncbi:MAG: DUF3857 domain-containing protein [Bacteroidales bacterium]|nr:DUF3857 domain-containing protein [Bacteroidales bacterium]